MAKVLFIYDGIKTDIYCNITDTIKEIVEKYSSKIQIDLNTLIFYMVEVFWKLIILN